ncbi:MAG: hypothetical protein WCJ71_10840, partial [Candidatus Omnitrophota bacterium]
MNNGERNELILKLKLVSLIGKKTALFGTIRTVGFDGIEYFPLQRDADVNVLRSCTDAALERVASHSNIQKSPTFSKSDVYINSRGYSVKSFAAAPPALVNHTTRPGFEFACRNAEADITDLDKLINEYWALRENKRIGEDIRNSDPLSPFSKARAILSPVLIYFLFTGTGSRLSNHPAEFILDYSDPLDETTWKSFDHETAIEHIWDHLIFSVRSKKGMP